MTEPDVHERLQRLIDVGLPREVLLLLLRTLRERLAADGNDFAWSGWADAASALADLDPLIARLQRAELPDRVDLAGLFAPTGPLQEIALSSGWTTEAEALARVWDRLAPLLWPPA